MMPNSGRVPQAPIAGRLPLSGAGQAALRTAAGVASRRGDAEITPLHLVAALVAEPSDAPPGASRPRLGSAVAGVLRNAAAAAQRAGAREIGRDDLLAAAVQATAGAAGENSAAAAPGHDWPDDGTGAADAALRVLAGREPRLVLLTGAPGTLPHRVLSQVVRRLASPAVPAALRNAQVVRVEGGPPLQSLGHRTRAQLRALDDVSPAVGVLDDVAAVLAAPAGTDAVLAALASGVRLVAAGDSSAGDVALATAGLRQFVRLVTVPALSDDATVPIVRAQAPGIGRHHGVMIGDRAPEAAVHLAGRLRTDTAQPGAALDLLDEGCAAASQRGAAAVEVQDIALAAGGGALLPGGILAARAGDVGDLEGRLRQRVIGQDHAVRAVADAILRAETGVRDPDRPLGSFLFLGPTGVGKTELARTLATVLFSDERALLRLDMGEYQEAHSVARLVGAPPGYVGYAEGGHLTEPLRRRPYSVVLFDEIEKAHSDVVNVLLGVLDEGRLTDGSGNLVDARNAVLIMTSNLGGRLFAAPVPAEELDRRVRAAVTEHFPPEFVGRVDDVVVFGPLSSDDLTAIAGLQIDRVLHRLAARDFSVEVSPDVCAWLAAQVISSPHGARPLRAAVRTSVEDVVARAVLEGRLEPGGRLGLHVRGEAIVEASPW